MTPALTKGDVRWINEGCECDRLGHDGDECVYDDPCPNYRQQVEVLTRIAALISAEAAVSSKDVA